MANNVAIGIQDFSKLREANRFYIDKTSFIKEWWESGDEVTLITRPRRFGKTLNVSMVEQFFSLEYANRGELFEGLSIWEEEKYRDLQGTYPVISLSFARIKESTFEHVQKRIIELLMSQFEKYTFLTESDKLSQNEKDYMWRMAKCMDAFEAGSSLHRLSEFLYRYYGKKVIILLDEYDTPMHEAYVNGFWDDVVAFTRSLFNATFKTNPFMEKTLMTGITVVGSQSMFSDFNNVEEVTTTSTKYATSFGFTEAEVFRVLEENGMGAEKEEVKKWYDGFTFGKHKDIYNPWSITHFLDKGVYDFYWANTSSNALVNKLIQEGKQGIKQSMEQLLKGIPLKCYINKRIAYSDLDDNEEAIWSLLVASGYLKISNPDKAKEDADEVEITNLEVKFMFENMVRKWFAKEKDSYNDFIRAMFSGDIEAMNHYMKKITLQMFSYFDTGKGVLGEEPTSFGFTEAEVFRVLEENGMGAEKEEVKKWYDGFTFGKHKDIYNPWSITHFLDKGVYDFYWANTSSNALVNKLIQEGKQGIKQSMEQLLKGIPLKCYINKRIAYSDLDDNEEAIWSLLVASGYLKISNPDKAKEDADEVEITNLEVKFMFENMVRKWFAKEKDSYNDFIRAMFSGDIEAMNHYMKKITLQMFSYFDTGKGVLGEEPERFYHGFVLGLLVDLNKEYVITSNRESGFGRYDVMIEPKDKDKSAVILEFKVFHPKKETTLEDTVKAALAQIEEKQYETILLMKGIRKEKIQKYGFAFEGKNVLIGGDANLSKTSKTVIEQLDLF